MQEELSSPKEEPPISPKLMRKSVAPWQRYIVIVLVVSLFSSFVLIGISSLRNEPASRIDKNPEGLNIAVNNKNFPALFYACGKWSELVEKSKEVNISMEQMTVLITEIDDIAQSSKSPLLKESTKNLKEAIIAEDIVEFQRAIPTLNRFCNYLSSNSDINK
jgi:hypothetical protein